MKRKRVYGQKPTIKNTDIHIFSYKDEEQNVPFRPVPSALGSLIMGLKSPEPLSIRYTPIVGLMVAQ